MSFTIRSDAFASGQRIPVRYTRQGENVSPPLQWAGAPPKTKSYALVVEDPDAPRGTFRHWAVYDIPPDRDGLDENSGIMRGPAAASSGNGFRVAVNDFGQSQYDGPQPPPGHGSHHYHSVCLRWTCRSSRSLRVPVLGIWQRSRGITHSPRRISWARSSHPSVGAGTSEWQSPDRDSVA
jgi:Raf kinase inhibitor-like YbhB/YbcL family protein